MVGVAVAVVVFPAAAFAKDNAGVSVQDAAAGNFGGMDPPASQGEQIRLQELAKCICKLIHGDATTTPPTPHCMPEWLQRTMAAAKRVMRLNVATKSDAKKHLEASAMAAGLSPAHATAAACANVAAGGARTNAHSARTFFIDSVSAWTKWFKKAAVVDEAGALDSLLPGNEQPGEGFSSSDSYPAATRAALKRAMTAYQNLKEASQTLAFLLNSSEPDPNLQDDHLDTIAKLAKYVKLLKKKLCDQVEAEPLNSLPSTDRHMQAFADCKQGGDFLLQHSCQALSIVGGRRWR